MRITSVQSMESFNKTSAPLLKQNAKIILANTKVMITAQLIVKAKILVKIG